MKIITFLGKYFVLPFKYFSTKDDPRLIKLKKLYNLCVMNCKLDKYFMKRESLSNSNDDKYKVVLQLSEEFKLIFHKLKNEEIYIRYNDCDFIGITNDKSIKPNERILFKGTDSELDEVIKLVESFFNESNYIISPYLFLLAEIRHLELYGKRLIEDKVELFIGLKYSRDLRLKDLNLSKEGLAIINDLITAKLNLDQIRARLDSYKNCKTKDNREFDFDKVVDQSTKMPNELKSYYNLTKQK